MTPTEFAKVICFIVGCVLLAVAVSSMSGCSTTYDGCKDPYIKLMPEQCHATFNRTPLRWEDIHVDGHDSADESGGVRNHAGTTN